MPTRFRIHPAIGIARLGNSPTSFYIAPEQAGVLPIDCDQDGNPIVVDGEEVRVTNFRDPQGRIRRQAARFRVFVYDDANPQGRELAIGETVGIVDQETGQLLTVRIQDIKWTVYLANKKAEWYEFQELAGEHGYASDHALRNAGITNGEDRRQLIIDPGPRNVRYHDPKQRRAEFNADGGPTSFPPPLRPNSITSLGDILSTQQDNRNRLLVLGGFGNSGSMLGGFGNPKIEEYANNDGWFDDIADGPVTARFDYTLISIDGQPAPTGVPPPPGPLAAVDPAWVIVGYPRYAPEFVDIVTMDDLVFDIAVREFGYLPYIYGVPPFTDAPPNAGDASALADWRRHARFNQTYCPYFWRDIWPILRRPADYGLVMDRDAFFGGNPHDIEHGGNFDRDELRVAPYEGEDPAARESRRAKRQLLYTVLRKPGLENQVLVPESGEGPDRGLFMMPLLSGDNPLTNEVPSKFLRLTETMLFLLRQWAKGLFIDEKREGIDPGPQPPGPGAALDRGVLAVGLGGSFCPGGEATWIMRNPAIYESAYRIRQARAPERGALHQADKAKLNDGLEPGDITKYSAVPWQADFNECTTEPIDITYRDWNQIDPKSVGDPVFEIKQLAYWWPAHRPVWVNNARWSTIPENNAGDLQMVTAWTALRFVLKSDDRAKLD